METLATVVEKFSRGRQSLAAMTPENEGKKCLVPITASLFVPATMVHTDVVIVDVGAQHYITKTIDEARDYNTRRIKAVQENIAQIEQMIQKKRSLRDGATFIIQQKIAQQTARH